MEKKKICRIEKKDLKNWLGRPVWYQCLSDINDFGWAFIHPETVKADPGYCRLIMADPEKKDHYNWNEIRLFNKAAFHGICRYCEHYRKGMLIRCALIEKGKTDCCRSTKYRNFEAAPSARKLGYSVRTFLRLIRLSGYEIVTKPENGKETSC